MAVMWPRMLMPDVTGYMLRSTECEVFRRLEAALDESFVVFYSRPWLGLKLDGEEYRRRMQFHRRACRTRDVDARSERWRGRLRSAYRSVDKPRPLESHAQHQESGVVG